MISLLLVYKLTEVSLSNLGKELYKNPLKANNLVEFKKYIVSKIK